MKIILIASLMFASLSSFAAPAGEEAATVARLLINNPTVVAKLKKENTTALAHIKAKTVKPGVTKYVLSFVRDCHCIPATAVTTILEDLTPTYADGAPVYQANVNIVNAQE